MNETTNIPAILRGKPQGTKLHDLVRGTDVFLNNVVDGCDKVCCTFVKNGSQKLHYSPKGTLVGFEDGMVILVPSKEMRDWEKFSWKKGDMLVSNDGGTEVIFDNGTMIPIPISIVSITLIVKMKIILSIMKPSFVQLKDILLKIWMLLRPTLTP